jgi:tRNA nucleotidyltransferase (CCA-adding enzyme)
MEFNEQIKIPLDVEHIIKVLNSNKYEAFIVGGCVRDSIMGRVPQDWDIASNAKPDEVKSLFDKTIDTGIKHGTVTVVLNGQNYEITTYRIDGKYSDNRHPKCVEFTNSIEGDLARRDFTINAIAYHPKKGFIDPFNGKSDILNRLIRSVGNPDDKFNEDALRMLRAVRFSARLNFSLDKNVFDSIKHNNRLIINISMERIRDELTKILVSENPMKFILLRETGLLKYILPEFDICFDTDQNHPYHIYNVALHSLNAALNIKSDKVLRWTMLLHDIGKPVKKSTDAKNIDHFYGHQEESANLAKIILNRLKFDNKSIEKICILIKYHDLKIATSHKAVRKAVRVVGGENFNDIIRIQKADKKAQNLQYSGENLIELDKIEDVYLDINEKGQCITLKDLSITGDDLINIGFSPGKNIKIMLNKLLDTVIENPELNSKEKLIELVNDYGFRP